MKGNGRQDRKRAGLATRSLKGLLSVALMASSLFVATPGSAATIAVVGSRSELDTIATAFTASGDTVLRISQDWAALSNAQLDGVFASQIVWEGDVFSALSAGVQTRMQNFVESNHGLFLTAERPCCEAHNATIQTLGRTLTGDNGLVIGGLGFDLFGHTFSGSPTTILTDPNDIRLQPALHDGPGQVSPTGGITSDACFTVSGSGPNTFCTAAAWGPDVLEEEVGRLVIYGDINSQPSLTTQFNGDQFENIRSFLLTGFTGGGDVCDENPNLPGCDGQEPPPSSGVPLPGALWLMGIGLGVTGARRLIGRS